MGKKKNVLVLTYWSYKDALVQAYTLPYVNIISDLLPPGSKIFLVTLEQPHQKMSVDEKMQVKERLRMHGIRLITLRYAKVNPLNFLYWAWSGFYLYLIALIYSVHSIHAWCTTAGSLGYLLSLVTGKKLIIDSYEPHAEAMVENKTWKKDSFQFRMLFYLEKKMSARAHTIISATEAMRSYAKEKYNLTFDTFYVKPACVDLDKFSLMHRKNSELMRQFGFEQKIVCVYAGKFGGIYQTNEVFDFFKACENFWGDRFRVLLLTSHNKQEIAAWCKKSMFDINKMVTRFVSHADIPDYMGLGDFAITPVKPIPTKRYCTPIKDGEYWGLGLPVVIPPRISDDSELIEENKIGAIISIFDEEHYKKAVSEIDALLKDEHINLTGRIRNVALKYRNYDLAKNIYTKIYK